MFVICFIECFHSRGQHLCKFIGIKESVCIRKEFNSQRTRLGHQHGRRFIVLGHQYGRRDVMWKHSISQWMKRCKHGFFVFPPKKTPIWRRHCSIGQSCCSMTSKRSIDWFLESSRAWSFFSRAFAQPTKTHSRLYPLGKPIKSVALTISVHSFFLFCSNVFISSSYENRSNSSTSEFSYR